MKLIRKILLVLPLALPVTIFLVRWPVAFALVGGGLCVMALIVMAVQIATSAPKLPPLPPERDAAVDVSEVQHAS